MFIRDRDTSNTAVIASLIFLLSGQDFAETETKDTKEIKEAKKNAVKAVSYTHLDVYKRQLHTVWSRCATKRRGAADAPCSRFPMSSSSNTSGTR